MKLKSSLLAVALFGGLSSVSMAADNYVGGGFGTTDPDVGSFDDSDTLRIFGGQRFGNLGYEVGYQSYDKFKLPGSLVNERVEGSSLDGTVVGYLPLGKQFDLFGKVGLAFWDLENKDDTGATFSDDGIDLTYGIGAQFKPMDNLSLRVEYTIINDASGADLSSTMFGAAFHF